MSKNSKTKTSKHNTACANIVPKAVATTQQWSLKKPRINHKASTNINQPYSFFFSSLCPSLHILRISRAVTGITRWAQGCNKRVRELICEDLPKSLKLFSIHLSSKYIHSSSPFYHSKSASYTGWNRARAILFKSGRLFWHFSPLACCLRLSPRQPEQSSKSFRRQRHPQKTSRR